MKKPQTPNFRGPPCRWALCTTVENVAKHEAVKPVGMCFQ